MSSQSGVKRVKSGCITCRIRRVKCDEQKPQCQRCLSTGRRCDGYSNLPFSRRDLEAASQSALRQTSPGSNETSAGVLPRLVTDPAFGDLLEKRYFQFFRQRSVASTNAIVRCRFWDRIVLQTCHTEPAVKHAVLALSSLHQLSSLPPDSDTSMQHRRYAEMQHQKALAEARLLIASAKPEDVDRVLIACIIFIIFESVRGEWQAASVHMDSGRAIVAQNLQRLKHTGRRKDLLEIEHAMARLDLPAICFSDRSTPYRYDLQDFHKTKPKLKPNIFQDVSEAQDCFIDLLRWLLLVGNHMDAAEKVGDLPALAKFQAEKLRCGAAIDEWHPHFESTAKRADASQALMIINMRLWYTCAQLLLQAEGCGEEMRYDAFGELWEEMVCYGEQLAQQLYSSTQSGSFSFDFGYIIPVYLAATRCRDPRLRRRALHILHSYPRQEGVWESRAAAAVAARWIETEEAGLEVTCACDIPEHRRIRFIATHVDIEGQRASVKLSVQAPEASVEVSASWGAENASADFLLRGTALTPDRPPSTGTPEYLVLDADALRASKQRSRSSSWESSLPSDPASSLAVST